MLGGRPHYAKAPAPVRYICAGFQHNRILERFPTIAALDSHLRSLAWEMMR